jgi:hypothetical protein
MSCHEITEDGVTATARKQAWHPPLFLEAALLQEPPKSFTAADIQFL